MNSTLNESCRRVCFEYMSFACAGLLHLLARLCDVSWPVLYKFNGRNLFSEVAVSCIVFFMQVYLAIHQAQFRKMAFLNAPAFSVTDLGCEGKKDLLDWPEYFVLFFGLIFRRVSDLKIAI